jgi:hypothetical protein
MSSVDGRNTTILVRRPIEAPFPIRWSSSTSRPIAFPNDPAVAASVIFLLSGDEPHEQERAQTDRQAHLSLIKVPSLWDALGKMAGSEGTITSVSVSSSGISSVMAPAPNRHTTIASADRKRLRDFFAQLSSATIGSPS